MSPLVPIVMFGWIPVVIYLFGQYPARRALIISIVAAWLFLPVAEFKLTGIPGYTKMSATCYGILLATAIYDVGRFSTFKPGWLDLPMLIWCVCPFASSITNGLGLYDGFSGTLAQTVTWGLPYFLGRTYLNNLPGMRQLAVGIFVGGLIYVPLCLLENIISPQLHRLIYGFYAHASGISQSMRLGGWRPMVFMEHGLMVGVWMMSATLIGIWLWRTKAIAQLWGFPMSWLVLVLLTTFILCRSTGAYTLLGIGIVILFVAKWLRVTLPLLLLVAFISSYLYLGVTGTFSSGQVVSSIAQVTGAERAQSLEFRFENEEILGTKARQKMVFGWGGWGRALVVSYQSYGNGFIKHTQITDSLWIIAFGNYGLVGLMSLTASLLLPVGWFVLQYPPRFWSNPQVAPAAVLAVLLALYMLDCVLNSMINPIFTLASGGLTGLLQGTGQRVQHKATSLKRDRRRGSGGEGVRG